MKSPEVIQKELAAFFAAEEVEWKPQATSGDKALAICYVDARCVMDRLDAVLGIDGWQDDYTLLPDGNVECTLRLKIEGEWISKSDVGGESDQKDAGDKRKAAYSDALKRAAVKWGIGRYLYSLPQQWVPYDQQKKRFVNTPVLPAKFLPGGKTEPKTAEPKPVPSNLPANGLELQRRLYEYDVKLAKQGLIPTGALITHIVDKGKEQGWEPDIASWQGSIAMEMVAEWTKKFEAAKRAGQKKAS